MGALCISAPILLLFKLVCSIIVVEVMTDNTTDMQDFVREGTLNNFELGGYCDTQEECEQIDENAECMSNTCQCSQEYIEDIGKCWKFESWAPRNFTLLDVGPTFIQVGWEGPLVGHDHYVVSWLGDEFCSVNVSDALTSRIEGLTSGSMYHLRVHATRIGHDSKRARIDNRYTRPEPPTSFSTEDITHLSISVAIEDDQDFVQSFKLVTMETEIAIREDIVFKTGDVTHFNITGLVPVTEYVFCVWGILKESPDVLSTQVDSQPQETLVGQAANLSLGFINSTAMLVQWDSAEGSWDSYTLEVIAYGTSVLCTKLVTDVFSLEVFCGGLISGVFYKINVATNLAGRESNTIGIVDHTPPRPPTDLKAAPLTSTSITLNWTLTVEMGNYDGFSIEYETEENETSVVFLSKGHENNYAIEDLQPGTQYTFDLASFAGTESNHRKSAALSEIERTLPQEPGTPTIRSRTSSQLEVVWDNPSLGNWDAFDITYEPKDGTLGNYTMKEDHTEVVLSGLNTGAFYRVTVATLWQGYTSRSSNDTLQTTPLAASEPMNVGIIEQWSNQSITIHWDQPSHLNGILQSYNISYREAPDEREPGELHWVIVNDTDMLEGMFNHRSQSVDDPLTFTLDGLKSGMAYDITVSAINDCCDGTKSGPIKGRTQAWEPPAIDLYTEDVQSRSMVICWDYPTVDNGQIKRYYFQMKDQHGQCVKQVNFFRIPNGGQNKLSNPVMIKRNQECVKNDTGVYHLYHTIQLEVKDLSPYNNYTFTVIPENDFGLGEQTIFKEETGEDVPDDSPKEISIVNDTEIPTRAIIISWSPPDTPNGIITHYDVRLEQVGQQTPIIVSSPLSPLRVDDLTSYVTYKVTLQASTIVGGGPWTDEVQVLTAEHYPGPPSDVTIDETFPVGFDLSWKPPTEPNGIIRSYRLKYESLDVGLVNQTGDRDIVVKPGQEDTLEYYLEGLHPCVPYQMTVSAFTTIGESLQRSIVLGQTTENVITNPAKNIKLTSSNPRSIDVTWSEPADETCSVNYAVYLLDSDDELGGWMPEHTKVVADGETLAVTMESLRPYWPYQVRVAALNSANQGNNSTLSDIIRTEETLPGRVQSITPTMCGKTCAVPSAVKLLWEPPAKTDRNGIIINYHIKVFIWKENSLLNHIVQPVDPNVKDEYEQVITGLDERQVYFQVEAETKVGVGTTRSTDPFAIDGDSEGHQEWTYIVGGVVGFVAILVIIVTVVVIVWKRNKGFTNQRVRLQEDALSTSTASTLDAASRDTHMDLGSLRSSKSTSSHVQPRSQLKLADQPTSTLQDDFYKILT